MEAKKNPILAIHSNLDNGTTVYKIQHGSFEET